MKELRKGFIVTISSLAGARLTTKYLYSIVRYIQVQTRSRCFPIALQCDLHHHQIWRLGAHEDPAHGVGSGEPEGHPCDHRAAQFSAHEQWCYAADAYHRIWRRISTVHRRGGRPAYSGRNGEGWGRDHRAGNGMPTLPSDSHTSGWLARSNYPIVQQE